MKCIDLFDEVDERVGIEFDADFEEVRRLKVSPNTCKLMFVQRSRYLVSVSP